MSTITGIGATTEISAGTAETALNTAITNLGSDPSPTDMLKVQRQLSIYTILIDLSSSLTKSLADSIKSIIQKTS